VGTVLPPITVAVFLGAMGYRIWGWRKLPQPKMTLFPTPPGGLLSGVLKETLLFPSLFAGDKVLWSISWVFHATLLLILVGHVRVVTDFPWLWASLGIDADTMSAVIGGAAGVAIMTMATLLLLRRLGTRRVREISSGGDYFALLLILTVILTGNAMRFVGHFDLALTREYFAGLVTLQNPSLPDNPLFIFHFFCGQLLFVYIPFSKVMHLGGIFFTHAAVKRS
jgi:nitrate reductase gamma subunit